MKEAKGLKEKVYFIATGIRLHAKLYLLKLSGKLKKCKYCVAFPSIKEGLRAEKVIKASKTNAYSIPIPDEIFKDCGIGIITTAETIKTVIGILERENITISGVYVKNTSGFEETVI